MAERVGRDRRVAYRDNRIVEIAVVEGARVQPVFEADDFDPGRAGRFRGKPDRLQAAGGVQQVGTVIGAERTQGLDRQDVPRIVHNGRGVEVIHIGRHTEQEVCEMQTPVGELLKIDADLVGTTHQEQAERLAFRRFDGDRGARRCLGKVREQNPALADRAGRRVEEIGAERVGAVCLAADHGDVFRNACPGKISRVEVAHLGRILHRLALVKPGQRWYDVVRVVGIRHADLALPVEIDLRYRAAVRRHGVFSDQAHAGSVVFELDAGGEGGAVDDLDHIVEMPEGYVDAEPGLDEDAFVLGDTWGEFEIGGRAEFRARLHGPARLVARIIGRPFAVVIDADEIAVVVVFVIYDDLAEVPDVARRVLGVPVEGILDEQVVLVDRIADHGGRDATHLECRRGGKEVIALGRDLAGHGVGFVALIAQHVAGSEREVWIVDRRTGNEGRGTEVGQDGHGDVLQDGSRCGRAGGPAAAPRRRAWVVPASREIRQA